MSETKITKLIYIFLYEKNKMITSNMNTIQIILSSIFEINNNTKKKKNQSLLLLHENRNLFSILIKSRLYLL